MTSVLHNYFIQMAYSSYITCTMTHSDIHYGICVSDILWHIIIAKFNPTQNGTLDSVFSEDLPVKYHYNDSSLLR